MHGQFVWYELMTTDIAAATAFYGAVVGWETRDSGMTDFDYKLVGPPGFEMAVAGVMALTDDVIARGVPSNWTGYVAVDDVDATVEAFKAQGGVAHKPPADIPGIGRFAVVADPQGAVICLFKPNPPDGPMPPMLEPSAPGGVGWNELHAIDSANAFDFYSAIFGWKKDMAVDMGTEFGIYQTFSHDGRAIGGMLKKMAGMPTPFWTFYFTVPSIHEAAAKVTAHGGEVLMGPHQVPGGSWIVSAEDPQGGYFALTAARE